MAQHTDLFLSTKRYTRHDHAALRSYCLNIPFATIARLYYTEESPQVACGLEKYLLAMRDDLIERAIANNPLLAKGLQQARCGGHQISAKSLKVLRDAAEIPDPIPQTDQPITLWMKPKTTQALHQEGIKTIAELMNLIERRGTGWWRAIPRIGRLKAHVLVRWLQRHAATLGTLVTDNNLPSPAPTNLLLVSPQHATVLAPLGRFTTSRELDGSYGLNRAQQFCFIQSKNDLEAIEFYLSRYVDQPHTLRAYRKELERFLLWGIVVRGKPLSSLLVDDCEAYKVFITAPCSSFVGPKAPRFSPKWKPFSEKPLNAKSQRYALMVIRAAFDYLVGVRYLGGNPWIAVKDPSVKKEINPIHIHKALPASLWEKVIAALEERAVGSDALAAQFRIALTASLLMGDSGLRREEVTTLRRADIIKSTFGNNVWECRVTGKGNKERLVPVSQRTMAALQKHWADRLMDFFSATDDEPLIAPLHIPLHTAAQQKHAASLSGYRPNNLSRLLKTTFLRLFMDPLSPFTAEEQRQLFSTTAHHLRHTFGTLSVASGMPMDVTQYILGHASSSTTAIYVQAQKQRMMEEASRFFDTDKALFPNEG